MPVYSGIDTCDTMYDGMNHLDGLGGLCAAASYAFYDALMYGAVSWDPYLTVYGEGSLNAILFGPRMFDEYGDDPGTLVKIMAQTIAHEVVHYAGGTEEEADYLQQLCSY